MVTEVGIAERRMSKFAWIWLGIDPARLVNGVISKSYCLGLRHEC